MTEGLPLWVIIVGMVLTSGTVGALAPVLLNSWLGRDRARAEVESIEADTLVKLQQWSVAAVAQMEAKIDELRRDKAETERILQAEIDDLRRRLDAYDKALRDNGITPPVLT